MKKVLLALPLLFAAASGGLAAPLTASPYSYGHGYGQGYGHGYGYSAGYSAPLSYAHSATLSYAHAAATLAYSHHASPYSYGHGGYAHSYSAPIVKAVAPVAFAAPVVKHVVPAATSYANTYKVSHSHPVVHHAIAASIVAAPVVHAAIIVHAPAYHVPLAYSAHSAPYADSGASYHGSAIHHAAPVASSHGGYGGYGYGGYGASYVHETLPTLFYIYSFIRCYTFFSLNIKKKTRPGNPYFLHRYVFHCIR